MKEVTVMVCKYCGFILDSSDFSDEEESYVCLQCGSLNKEGINYVE